MLTTTTQPTGNIRQAPKAQKVKAHNAACLLNTTNMQRYTTSHVTQKLNMVINIMFHKPGTGWQ